MSSLVVRPFTLGLCAYIALLSDVNSPLEENREDLIRLLQEVIEDRSAQTTLTSLAHQIQTVDQECAQVWTQVLRTSAESIDSLLDLSSSFQKAIEDGVIDGSSQAGILVRSTCLALDDMLFDRLGSLWKRYHDEISDLIEGSSHLESNQQSQHSMESLRLPCVALDETGLTECIQNLYLNDSPESHFLAFLHYLSEGERVGALHSLHQFVDTAMIAERKKEYDTSKRRGNVLGHAAVLLASVHAKFGEGALHKLATEEALRVAQQSGDAASIAFAMGLLYESSSGGAPHDVLQQCTTRAAAAKAQSLATSAYLALAKELLSKGNIQGAWREWMQSTNEKPADSMSVWTDRPAKLTTDTSRAQSQQLITEVEMWETLGFYGMSSLLAKIGLKSDNIGPMERTQLISKTVQASMYGPKSRSHNSICRYQRALDMLVTLNLNQKDFLQALVMHEWAIRLGNFLDAHVLLAFLQSYVNPRMPNYVQARIQVCSQHALLLSRQGRFDNAKMVLNDVLDICKKENLTNERVITLLQLAISELNASPGVFTGALKPLLECMELTTKLSMDSLNATTLSLMAQIHLRLSKPNKALPILKAVLPTLRQQGHVWYFAEAHFTIAKCHLALAKDNGRRDASLKEAIQSLKTACDIFVDCNDLQRLKAIFYLQAQVYNSFPDKVVNRDKASKMFMNLTTYVNGLNNVLYSRTINTIFKADFNIPNSAGFLSHL